MVLRAQSPFTVLAVILECSMLSWKLGSTPPASNLHKNALKSGHHFTITLGLPEQREGSALTGADTQSSHRAPQAWCTLIQCSVLLQKK